MRQASLASPFLLPVVGPLPQPSRRPSLFPRLLRGSLRCLEVPDLDSALVSLIDLPFHSCCVSALKLRRSLREMTRCRPSPARAADVLTCARGISFVLLFYSFC